MDMDAIQDTSAESHPVTVADTPDGAPGSAPNQVTKYMHMTLVQQLNNVQSE